MSRPFPTTPGELIIWEVGNNRCQSLHHMHSGKLKDIIQRCWFPDAEVRPSFKELLGTLEQNVSINVLWYGIIVSALLSLHIILDL